MRVAGRAGLGLTLRQSPANCVAGVRGVLGLGDRVACVGGWAFFPETPGRVAA